MADVEVKRGQVWWVRDAMSVGSEISAGRTAVVVSCAAACENSPIVSVAYTTTQGQVQSRPWNVDTFLNGKKERILCNQIQTVDKSRLDRVVGQFGDDVMRRVDRAIAVNFGFSVSDPAQERELKELREKQKSHEEELIRLQVECGVHKKLYEAALEKLVAARFERDLEAKAAEPEIVEESVVEEDIPVEVTGLLNPNTCTFDEMRANGVTSNLCLQIIANRPYREMSELAALPGVNDWVYDRLCEGMYIPPVEKPKKENDELELVELNTCTEDDLRRIGFRPDVVKMIIAARPYTYVDDLRGVPGVTRIAYQLVEKKVTVVPVVKEKPTNVEEPVKVEEPVTVEDQVTDDRVNVNEAGGKEIHEKTGINLNTCYSIVGYRKKYGPYKDLTELINVTNFSARMLEKHRDKMKV